MYIASSETSRRNSKVTLELVQQISVIEVRSLINAKVNWLVKSNQDQDTYPSSLACKIYADLTSVTEIYWTSSNVTIKFLIDVSEDAISPNFWICGSTHASLSRLVFHLWLVLDKWFIVPLSDIKWTHIYT